MIPIVNSSTFRSEGQPESSPAGGGGKYNHLWKAITALLKHACSMTALCYGSLRHYQAATEHQQLWHTCELRSDQLLPDRPPLTPLGAFWMEVFLVHPR